MVQRRPSLFLIGAMKSGTRYLTKLLKSHPSIFMSDPEEPSYFVEQAQLRKVWAEMWDGGYWKEENYLRLFQAAENETILRESSTNYTKLPLITGVPERIHKFDPDARFIYVMRDPVERTRSHYWQGVGRGERRSMLDAIKEEPLYCDVSYYAMQLTPFIKKFGRKRIHLLTFEELTSYPKETMKDIWKWLEIDSSVDPSGVDQPENVTPELVNMATMFGVPQRLRFLPIMRSIIPRLPPLIRRWGQKGIRLARRQIDPSAIDTSDVIAFLRPIQTTQTEELVQLVGRDFPEWMTLYDKRETRAVSGK